jgi:flagellar hook protein FlgE
LRPVAYELEIVMGIFDALTSAVTGLQAQSFALQNISGNIANSQTTGFKETDTSFQDMVSAAALNEQTAGGVISSSVATNTVQGTIQSASVPTDMAINGAGFFVVAKPTGLADNQPQFSGVNDYTRAGDFQTNSSGYLVNSAGYYLMGIPVDAATGNPVGSVPQVLQFNNNFIPAQTTTSINYNVNLPSTPTSGEIAPGDFANNPVAGAVIAGAGATIKPDAVAVGTGTVSSLTDATTLSSLGFAAGDKIKIGDGTNTTTYTVGGSTDTVGNLINAINSNASGNAAVTASLSGGSLVLTGNNDMATVSASTTGTGTAAELGFGSGNNSFSPTNLVTQGLAGTLSVSVGGGSPQTITIGAAAGDVETLAQLQTAIQGLTGVFGSVNTQNGDISLVAKDPTATLAVSGTGGASPSAFGIQTTTVAPGNGTVIGSDLSTFTSQSIDGGSITAYDSDGNPLNVQFRWAQVANANGQSVWNLYYQTNSNATGTQPAWQNVGTNFIFNGSGQLVQPTTSALTLPLNVNGDTLNNVEINFGANGLTQFANTAGAAQVTQLQQNGFAAGSLQSVSVDSNNRVVGSFSNGQTIPLAEITLANFNGANSLQALSGGAWAATPESGNPIFSGTGTIEGSSLESSNVDIATQFSELIVAQQAYSANARVMSTADQMIQSLLQVIQ